VTGSPRSRGWSGDPTHVLGGGRHRRHAGGERPVGPRDPDRALDTHRHGRSPFAATTNLEVPLVTKASHFKTQSEATR